MKTKTVLPVEFRVWCERCRIRIAPTEDRKLSRGKAYHTRCYSNKASAAPARP